MARSANQARTDLVMITSAGELVDLTYGGLTFWDHKIGTGMAPIKRLTEQGPDQDGVSDLGFRLDQRTIDLILTLTARTPEVLDSKQERIYNLFKPRDTAYSLRFRKKNRNIVRQIDCHTVAGPDFSTDEEKIGLYAPIYRVGIQVYAPDPVYYDPTVHSQSFGIAAGGGAWAIPWAIPWAIGSGTLDQSALIDYDGNWEEFPIITVVGPINDLIITNNTSGDVIDFTGSNIAVGDTYTIDLRPGHKTIVDQNGVNKISALSAAGNSDIATWSLLPDPEVADGINSIRVQGSAATTATGVFIRYYDRYIAG